MAGTTFCIRLQQNGPLKRLSDARGAELDLGWNGFGISAEYLRECAPTALEPKPESADAETLVTRLNNGRLQASVENKWKPLDAVEDEHDTANLIESWEREINTAILQPLDQYWQLASMTDGSRPASALKLPARSATNRIKHQRTSGSDNPGRRDAFVNWVDKSHSALAKSMRSTSRKTEPLLDWQELLQRRLLALHRVDDMQVEINSENDWSLLQIVASAAVATFPVHLCADIAASGNIRFRPAHPSSAEQSTKRFLCATLAALAEAGFRSGPWENVAVAIIGTKHDQAPKSAWRKFSEIGRELDLLELAEAARLFQVDVGELKTVSFDGQ